MKHILKGYIVTWTSAVLGYVVFGVAGFLIGSTVLSSIDIYNSDGLVNAVVVSIPFALAMILAIVGSLMSLTIAMHKYKQERAALTVFYLGILFLLAMYFLGNAMDLLGPFVLLLPLLARFFAVFTPRIRKT
jgi:hypothetical protein